MESIGSISDSDAFFEELFFSLHILLYQLFELHYKEISATLRGKDDELR